MVLLDRSWYALQSLTKILKRWCTELDIVIAIAEKPGASLYTRLPTTRSCIYIVVAASAAARLEQCITDVGRWMCANRPKLNADKTELLWVGSRHSLSQQDCCLPVLQLGSDSIVARDHVRLLGVTLSSDLSFDRHVSIVGASIFYWLRQLQRSRRSLDTPKVTTNKLQRMLNAAARVVSGTHKFDRGLSRLLHTELH